MEKVRNGTFTIYRKRVKMWHRDLRDLTLYDNNTKYFISTNSFIINGYEIYSVKSRVANKYVP
jgi:hypothetical protein